MLLRMKINTDHGAWGPAYPFIFHPNITRTMGSKEIKFPTAKHAYFGSNIIKTFYQPCENAEQSPGAMRFPQEIEELEKMLKIWDRGLSVMETALNKIPVPKRQAGERLAALGKFIRNSIITTINIKKWWLLNIALQHSSCPEDMFPILEKLRVIIFDEINNAQDTMPAVECDSRLGWEPSMGYVCDIWHLQWKVRHAESVLKEIDAYHKMIKL